MTSSPVLANSAPNDVTSLANPTKPFQSVAAPAEMSETVSLELDAELDGELDVVVAGVDAAAAVV